MTLDRILDRPESYICAAMGLSPLLFDLPSSSESRTYSNKEEARKGAWEDSLVPLLGVIAEAIQMQVLYAIDTETGEEEGRFGDAPGLEVWADTSEVPALQENMTEKAEHWIALVDAGLVKREYAASQLDIPEEAIPDESELMPEEPGAEESGTAEDFNPDADVDEDPDDAFDPATDDPTKFDFKAELDAFKSAEDLLDSLGLSWDDIEAATDEEIEALGLDEQEMELLGLQYEEDGEDEEEEKEKEPTPPRRPASRNGKPVKALTLDARGDCGCGG
jgi:hypothetical protein